MSHAANSPDVIGFPRFGVWANKVVEPKSSIIVTAHFPNLRVNMFHLTVPFDRPARDGVKVFVRKRRDGRHSRHLASRADELRSSRLYVPSFIPGATLQNCRTAVP